MQSSATREYPFVIQTYFDTHTVDGVFLRDHERLLYEEILRLQGLGTYTDDEIMAIVRRDKQWGHIPSVDKQAAEETDGHDHEGIRSDDKMSQLLTQIQSQPEIGSDRAGDDEPGYDEDDDEDEEDEDS
ncbi:hypothetical protein Tco_0163316 [Tanacetum coccineum]